MRGKRAGLAAVAVAIGGCHLVFEVDGNGNGDDEPPPCEIGDNASGFEAGCEPWGYVSETNGATVAVGNGAMVLTAGTGNTYAGCYSAAETDITRGTTLRIRDGIAPGQPVYFLYELFEAQGGPGLFLHIDGGVLIARAGMEGETQEVGRYTLPPGGTWLWRWRDEGAGWAAEISDDDGVTWEAIGRTPHHPTRAYPNFGIGSYSLTDVVNAVEIDAYNLCP